MSNVSKWSTTASNNQDVSPAGAQSGWTGSDVGPWARETMGGVARWYQDALWTALLFDGVGTKNSTKNASIDATLHLLVNALGGSDPTEHFPQGRLIKVIDSGGATHPGFIVSTLWNSGTLGGQIDATVKWLTAGPTVGVVSEDDVLFAVTGESANSGHYSKSTEALGGQLIGPTILSGGGTAAIRDLKFPVVANLPDGILWYNTTTDLLEASSGGAWVDAGGDFSDNGGGLTLDSPAGDPTLSLKEAGTQTSKLYHDLAGNKLTLENGDWSTGTGDHGRVYIDDADGKLYHQTKSAAVTATALSLTPGPDQGLEAEFLGGGIQNASYVAAADVTSGAGPPLTQYVERVISASGVGSGRWGGIAHGATIKPKLAYAKQRYTGAGFAGYIAGDELVLINYWNSNNSRTYGTSYWLSSTQCGLVSPLDADKRLTGIRADNGGPMFVLPTDFGDWEFVIRMWW